jgi:phage-related protein
MSYFTFNGVDSRDLGLILPETPFRPSWSEQVEEIIIPGRPEVIKNPNGIYDNQTLSINAIIADSSKIRQIYSTLTGEGRLILSTNTNEYINCRVETLIPTGVALDMAELPLTFDCYPFAYAITPTAVEIGTDYTIVNNTSSIYSAPIIRIDLQQDDAPILKGDVNFDGKITPVDASMVLAEIANIAAGTPTFTPEQFAAADMDDSGTLTAADASAILAIYADGQSHDPETPAQNVMIYTNGAQLIVGIPDEVIANGFSVYIDCGLYLIYYYDVTGDMVNIMNYSSLDLPLLHTGENFMKYSGENVTKVTVTINERWL